MNYAKFLGLTDDECRALAYYTKFSKKIAKLIFGKFPDSQSVVNYIFEEIYPMISNAAMIKMIKRLQEEVSEPHV